MKELNDFIKNMEIDRSTSVRYYTNSINRFLNYFNVQKITQINNIKNNDVINYRTKFSEGKKSSYVNSQFRPLNSFFNYLLKTGQITLNPLANIKPLKEAKRLPKFLSENEIRSILEATKNLEEKLMVSLMLVLGLRRSEIINLKVSDFKNNQVNIIGKGNKERKLYLDPFIQNMIDEYAKNHKSEYLFVAQGTDNKISGEALRLRIKSICKKAGIEDERVSQIHPHTMRHTFATMLYARTKDIRLVQKTMGHSSIGTTMIYADVVDREIENAMSDYSKSIFNNNKKEQ